MIAGEKRTNRIKILRELALKLVQDKSLSYEQVVESMVQRAIKMGVTRKTAEDYADTAVKQLQSQNA